MRTKNGSGTIRILETFLTFLKFRYNCNFCRNVYEINKEQYTIALSQTDARFEIHSRRKDREGSGVLVNVNRNNNCALNDAASEGIRHYGCVYLKVCFDFVTRPVTSSQCNT